MLKKLAVLAALLIASRGHRSGWLGNGFTLQVTGFRREGKAVRVPIMRFERASISR
jgi:hypothetical protein